MPEDQEREQSWSEGVVGGGVMIETGRGNAVAVQPGSPFQETVRSIAQRANYGGNFRVFLNGEELVDPNDSPATIEPGQRVMLTSYDKVG